MYEEIIADSPDPELKGFNNPKLTLHHFLALRGDFWESVFAGVCCSVKDPNCGLDLGLIIAEFGFLCLNKK